MIKNMNINEPKLKMNTHHIDHCTSLLTFAKSNLVFIKNRTREVSLDNRSPDNRGLTVIVCGILS